MWQQDILEYDWTYNAWKRLGFTNVGYDAKPAKTKDEQIMFFVGGLKSVFISDIYYLTGLKSGLPKLIKSSCQLPFIDDGDLTAATIVYSTTITHQDITKLNDENHIPTPVTSLIILYAESEELVVFGNEEHWKIETMHLLQ